MKTIAPAGFAHFVDDWHFLPIVDTGELAFLSGVTGVRSDGYLADDPETQFRDAFDILTLHLAATGLRFSDVAEMTTYHARLREHLPAFMKVKGGYIGSLYPAWTAVGVSELITEGNNRRDPRDRA